MDREEGDDKTHAFDASGLGHSLRLQILELCDPQPDQAESCHLYGLKTIARWKTGHQAQGRQVLPTA